MLSSTKTCSQTCSKSNMPLAFYMHPLCVSSRYSHLRVHEIKLTTAVLDSCPLLASFWRHQIDEKLHICRRSSCNILGNRHSKSSATILFTSSHLKNVDHFHDSAMLSYRGAVDSSAPSNRKVYQGSRLSPGHCDSQRPYRHGDSCSSYTSSLAVEYPYFSKIALLWYLFGRWFVSS
jgi:hypothetical protein